jgi:hypothetical protein
MGRGHAYFVRESRYLVANLPYGGHMNLMAENDAW